MRIRTQNIAKLTYARSAHPVVTLQSYCDGTPASNGGFTVPAFGPIVVEGRDERFSDELGKGRANECIHRRVDYFINSSKEDISYSNSVGGHDGIQSYSPAYYWVEWNKSIYDSALAWNLSSSDTPPGFQVTQLDQSEEMDLKTQLLERARQGLSDVPLNIIESNQIWPSLTSLATSIPHCGAQWKEIRKYIRTAPGAFLAWKFGISPLLSDVGNVLKYLKYMSNDLKKHYNNPSRRFSVVRQLRYSGLGENDIVGSTHPAGDPYIIYTRQGLVKQGPQVCYVLRTEPNTRYASEFFSGADRVLSRFATSPARLAWERIPFSFMVDWFIDIRGCLNAADKLVGQEPFKTVSFTRSYSYAFSANRRVRLTSPCNTSSTLDQWVQCAADYRHYERSRVLSGAYAPRWKPRFGKTQATITAALIFQALIRAGK